MTNEHTEHCCLLHGCKYRDETCPVGLQLIPQSHVCQECSDDDIRTVEEMKDVFRVMAEENNDD